jgi:deoxyribose-phosphate aldolase
MTSAAAPARREREEAAPAPSKPAAPDMKAMPGYNGKLDEVILARIRVLEAAIGVENLGAKFPHLGKSNWRVRAVGTDPAQYVDHTILRPEVTTAQVDKLCDEALKHKFFAVCVNGSRVAHCVSRLAESSVKVAAVIGFPLGAGTSTAKAFEAKELVEQGAKEIDMVMNVGAMKDKNYALVFSDIKAVVDAARPGTVKVIFETCLLTAEEIIDASILSVAAGAAFVKTSTGFDKGGATPEAVDAMLAVVGNEAEVKASGGVRDYDAAMAYISAGVTRIGTSSGIAIVQGGVAAAGAY